MGGQRRGASHLLFQPLLQPRADLVALLHHGRDVRLAGIEIVEEFAAVVSAEAQLDGGGVGVEVGLLPVVVAIRALSSRLLAPEVPPRHPLH